MDYGDQISVNVFEEHETTDTADGKPQFMTATDPLAAHVGLSFACDEDTYRGNGNFTAHAVGWTTKETGWLVVTPQPPHQPLPHHPAVRRPLLAQ